ncbi:hypothetical protein FOZ62_007921 [Perkinsus olseni]|uniref:Calmodulin n=1 Tax=Perkinsus olseni TaxID=32597 RepID=A0A7J6SZR3_PEROL|nr:hypothetical protein FOZ62_007921 [Perkinsus olseni]
MLLRGLGQTPTEKEGAAFLQGLPHKVSLDDFTDHLNKYYRPPIPSERLLEAFRVLDPARTGVISGAKLKQVITSLGEGLTNSEVEGIFADIKLDEDGNVNYAQLAELLNSGPTAVFLGTTKEISSDCQLSVHRQ